jgi:hypothetical protein
MTNIPILLLAAGAIAALALGKKREPKAEGPEVGPPDIPDIPDLPEPGGPVLQSDDWGVPTEHVTALTGFYMGQLGGAAWRIYEAEDGSFFYLWHAEDGDGSEEGFATIDEARDDLWLELQSEFGPEAPPEGETPPPPPPPPPSLEPEMATVEPPPQPPRPPQVLPPYQVAIATMPVPPPQDEGVKAKRSAATYVPPTPKPGVEPGSTTIHPGKVWDWRRIFNQNVEAYVKQARDKTHLETPEEVRHWVVRQIFPHFKWPPPADAPFWQPIVWREAMEAIAQIVRAHHWPNSDNPYVKEMAIRYWLLMPRVRDICVSSTWQPTFDYNSYTQCAINYIYPHVDWPPGKKTASGKWDDETRRFLERAAFYWESKAWDLVSATMGEG